MGQKFSIAQIRGIYDARAAIPFDGSTYKSQVAKEIEFISSFIGSTNVRLCDVGCGHGWHLTTWEEHGLTHLVGIDLSAASLKILLNRAIERRTQVPTLILGDVTQWQTLNQFDVVTSLLCCLGSMSREWDDRYLAALLRILRPKGTLVVSCFCHELVAGLTGTTRVAYSKAESTSVETVITYLKSTRTLTIRQNLFQPEAQLPTEKFMLYTSEELTGAMVRAGFVNVSLLPVQNLMFVVAGKE